MAERASTRDTRTRARRSAARASHRSVELHRWLSSALITGVLAMIPWTAYLAISLPIHFRAHNWNVAWVGFDSALMIVLALTAWAAWFRRQLLAATSVVAATMLLCDAWFDVNTSLGTRGEWVTILTALLANVPMALFFIWLARRIMLRTAAVLAAALRTGPAPHHAHDVSLAFVTTWRDPVADETAEPSPTLTPRAPVEAVDGASPPETETTTTPPLPQDRRRDSPPAM